MPSMFARRKTGVCLVVLLNLIAVPAVALAQDPAPISIVADMAAAQPPPAPIVPAPPVAAAPVEPKRPAALVPLYVSLASLQALDVASTVHGLNSGGVEANPLMRGALASPAAVVALKAGFTGLSIVATEKMWKRNRTAAIVMMTVLNGAYAAVVAHNYAAVK